MITGMPRIAIAVHDFDATVATFRDHLGMPVLDISESSVKSLGAKLAMCVPAGGSNIEGAVGGAVRMTTSQGHCLTTDTLAGLSKQAELHGKRWFMPRSDANRAFARRLKKARVNTGKTAADFARLIGMNAQAYREMERRGSLPSDLDTLLRITKLTGLDLHWLLAGRHIFNALQRQDHKRFISAERKLLAIMEKLRELIRVAKV